MTNKQQILSRQIRVPPLRQLAITETVIAHFLKEKIFKKYIALAFIILVGINLIGAFGINIWGMFNSYERNQKNSIQGQTREELEKEYRLEEIYFPKIDSLILKNPKQALEFIDNKVLLQYPDNDDVLMKKGVAFSYLDSIDLALKTFHSSMKMSGHRYPRILGYIAWAHKEKNQRDSALFYLQEADKLIKIIIFK